MISEKEYQERMSAAQRGELPRIKVTVEARRSYSPAGMKKELEMLRRENEELRFENSCLEEENRQLSRDAESWRRVRAMIYEQEGLV